MTVIDTPLVDESRDRYLTYALSVVSSRALPDVRDGLKPVQRRILFEMYRKLGLMPGKSHRKSAAVVGGVLAHYHPHGDTACYEAMVRMAQDFSLRYPLVDGQGNFGSLDGDSAAAYRYTEVKLRALALEVIGEIDEETVSFRDNFDSTEVEPVVLPSRIPNLLINGAMGIAVGLATSIPPHNLKDVVNALLELADDPEISPTKLAGTVKGPDFSTGCSILNTRAELNEIYKTGRGSVRMRGDWKEEEGNRGKRFIVITSIPYGVQKSQLVEKIADAIVAKSLPQLVDVRDESTDEVRVVLELASGADPEVAMAYLFKNTPLESNFNVNLTCLVPVKGSEKLRPEQLPLKEMLQHFLDFRFEVTQKKLAFEKRKLEERIHILEGLICIYDALDEAIRIVRKSEGRSDAADKLRKRFKLTEIQSFAVVDMRIYQLSRTSIEEIRAELKEKAARVAEIEAILKSKAKLKKLVTDDLKRVSDEYGDKRLSQIIRENIEIEFNEADYVVQEDVYAIVTRDGWVKRIRQSNELDSTRVREGDAILHAHAVSTLDTLLFFTNLGYLYAMKVIDLPSSSGYGDPIQKILKFRDGEAVSAVYQVARAADGAKPDKGKQAELFGAGGAGLKVGDKLVVVSKKGLGYVTVLEEIEGLKRSGKRVVKVRDGDGLAVVCRPKKLLGIFTAKGCGLVIDSKEIPERAGASVGVILMGVRSDDQVCGALPLNGKEQIKLLLESGGDKVIPLSDVTSGRRALKGTKVISRGGLRGVEVKE